MKKRILSVTLALCLCVSSQSVAYALQEETTQEETSQEKLAGGEPAGESPSGEEQPGENPSEKDSTGENPSEKDPAGESPSEKDPTEANPSEKDPTEANPSEGEPSGGDSTSGTVTNNSLIPTPTQVYDAMIALKDQDEYKEGEDWTNEVPYPNIKGEDYHWKGGPLDGANISAVGCVAFAFRLSDEAFGSLPARMYAAGGFTYEDIKPGDILRVNGDVHTVIVLEVSEAGVIVAEGNISSGDHKGKVHWGRGISKEEVMSQTSHYITRYPEGYVSPEDPDANTSIGAGVLEGGLNWNLTKAGIMTISGSGAMPDFSSASEQPWNDKSAKIRKVVIEEGVTSIGSCAFWDCGVLSAEISSSVTAIGNSAFRGSSILAVTIPGNVKTIGDNAFQECPNLKSAVISEGVETICQSAFQACKNLTSIALPASILEVGAAAFFQCQEMTNATFAAGSNQVKLGDNLFMQCYKLTSVTLPQNIDRIGDGMFWNCMMLAKVEIPKGAQSIGAQAFASCSGLTELIIPDSVTTIGIAAFSNSALKDIYYTGTEDQWNSIQKLGDTATQVSKVNVHYNYSPTTPPDTDNGGDNNNGDSSGSGGSSGGNSSGGNNSSGGSNSSGGGSSSGSNYGGGNYGGSNYFGGNNSGSGNHSASGDKTENNDKTQEDDKTESNVHTEIPKPEEPKPQEPKPEEPKPEISITCKKTMYKVAYGAKSFKIDVASEGKVTFTSSNPKIATVNKKTGKVTMKGTGVVTITIRAGDVSKKVTVKVSPKKQSVETVKDATGKKLKVKWTKDKMASGYQVQISTDKKFKKNVKTKKLTDTSYTFKKLKSGKKYYVRVRSYKKSGNQTLYGTWSS